MITEKEKNFISAVIYVHNDESVIGEFLTRVNKVLAKNFEKFELICVNDASDDGSVEEMKKAAEHLKGCPLSIIHMGFYQGLEMSMNAGVDLAIGDFCLEFDTVMMDYDPEMIMEVYRHSLKGYDIVAAANDKKSRLGSRLFYRLFNHSANTQYKLGTEVFRILSRRAINRVHALSKTIPYRKALYANCGLKMSVLHYTAIKDERSSPQKGRYNTAMDSLILFTDVGYKMSVAFALIMMAATVGIVIYTLLVFLLGQPVEGFTTIMLVMTGSFFGVFTVLAVILKYLSVLVNLVFKKQKYIIESIEKVTK